MDSSVRTGPKPIEDRLQILRDSMQAGPLMVRHVIHGHEVLLPADAVFPPKDETLEESMKRPLGGTWK